MLNKDLEVTLNLAFQQARDARHEYMTVEHLLLALIDNPAAQDALVACGTNLDKLREDVATFISQTTPLIADVGLEPDGSITTLTVENGSLPW